MNDLNHDPIFNVIQNQVKRSIRVLLDNGCWGAAAILIYSGMDMMARLSMPEHQVDVREKDFVTWADRYIHFPCKEQLTGLDLYGARCGMLHTFSPYSQKSRRGQSRLIGYMDKSVPEIRYVPNEHNLVLVSITGLAEAFFRGVDQSLIDMFSDPKKTKITEERLSTLGHTFTFKQQ